MNKSLGIKFGTDGWRAIMCDTFTFNNVRLVCQALAGHLQAVNRAHQGVIVAHDPRFLAEQFAQVAAEVMLGNSIPVWIPSADVPTPVAAHAVLATKAAGAIMFTASHNPPQYNGIKFIPHYGGPATLEITNSIESHLSDVLLGEVPVRRRTCEDASHLCRSLDPRPAYVQHISQIVDLSAVGSAGITIGYDAMHGAGRSYVGRILTEAGVNVHELHTTRDCLFGGTSPDPQGDHLGTLRNLVLAKQVHLGLATDGDADRFGIIDADGEYLTANEVISLLIPYLITQRELPGSMVRTVATTHLIDRLAAHFQRPVHETPVGFKHICDYMRRELVLIGGEESGGLSIYGHIPEKDGILACLLVAEVAATTGLPLGAHLRKWAEQVGPAVTRRIDLGMAEDKKAQLLNRLSNNPPDKVGKQRIGLVSTLDGVKYILENGSWLLIRASGTEPLVRIYLEAEHHDALRQLEHDVRVLVAAR